jgi:hypothetical protein
MTMTKNIKFVMSIVVIAFVAAGLAVIPSLQEANANELTLLKNDKDKKPKKNDYIIDEPVIKLLKNEKDKKPKKH